MKINIEDLDTDHTQKCVTDIKRYVFALNKKPEEITIDENDYSRLLVRANKNTDGNNAKIESIYCSGCKLKPFSG